MAVALAGRIGEPAPGGHPALGGSPTGTMTTGTGNASDDPSEHVVPLVNKFTIDDTRPGWAAPDRASSRRGRRLGGLANFRTDPYER